MDSTLLEKGSKIMVKNNRIDKTSDEKSLNHKGYIRSLDFKEVTNVCRHYIVSCDRYLEKPGPSSFSLSHSAVIYLRLLTATWLT